jgi:hypothetical protein
MQWDQHDSVRYAHINQKNVVVQQENNSLLDNVEQSQSTYFPKDAKELKEEKTHPTQTLVKAKSLKDVRKQPGKVEGEKEAKKKEETKK